eukprot:Em0023g444a
MDEITELSTIPKGLESDKVTERKRAASRLRELLEVGTVIEYIDNTSAVEHRPKGFNATTWRTLFKSIGKYVDLEGNAINRLEDKSAGTNSTRETKKKEVGDILRVYVKAASKNGPNLYVHDILSHMIQILNDQKMVVWLCNDYTQVLVQHIFTVPRYVMEITRHMWDELCALYFSLFMNPKPFFDRTLLTRGILSIVGLLAQHQDPPCEKIYLFFSEALKCINKEKSSRVVEHLLAAFNLFSTAVATSARGRLCKLGEDVFADLLQLWTKCQSSVQEHLVEFLLIQVRVHHPKGRHRDEDGAWSTNDILWKTNLLHLYKLIVEELEPKAKLRNEGAYRPGLLVLAADVVYQVVLLNASGNCAASETTQPTAKRQKYQSVWMTVRDNLVPESPCLVVCRKDALQWVCVSLHCLALDPRAHPESSCTGDLWKKVWTATLRMVSGGTAEEEGYDLLTAIVEQKLVEYDVEPWKLLNTTTSLASRSQLRFLVALLSRNPLPEIVPHSRTCCSPSLPGSANYPFRVQLLRFLLLCGSSEEDTASAAVVETSWINRPPVSLMARVVVALTQRTHSSLQLSQLKQLCVQESMSSYTRRLLRASPSDIWDEIEGIYLASTFDEAPDLHFHDKQHEKLQACRRTMEGAIPELLRALFHLLAMRTGSLMRPLEEEVTRSPRDRAQQLSMLLQLQVYHYCLVVHIVLLLCGCEMFPGAEQLVKEPAVETLQALLQCVCTAVKDPVWGETDTSEHYATIKVILEELNATFHFVHSHLAEEEMAAPSVSKALSSLANEVSVGSFPTELLEVMIQLANGKWVVPRVSASSITSVCSSSLASHAHSIPASFDEDLDSLGDRGVDNSEPFSPTATPASSVSPDEGVAQCGTSVRALCQLEAVECLCSWCKHSLQAAASSADKKRAIHLDSQLMNFIGDEHFQPSKPVHVQLVFRLCEILGTDHSAIKDEVLQTLMEAFSALLTENRKNQSIYRQSLASLSFLANHIATLPEHAPARTRCQKILTGFWGLYLEDHLSVSTRVQLARTIRAFLEVDPQSTWMTITVKKKKKNDLEETAVTFRDALITMVHDPDHHVRMFIARTVPIVYLADPRTLQLVSSECQRETFEKVSGMLQKAHQVLDDQDDLSREDDSVNRIASLMATLQHEACVSPVCEQKVVSLLAVAVGNEQIEPDLCTKALRQMAVYLGYTCTRSYLSDVIVSLVTAWKAEGLAFSAFPCQIFGFRDQVEFLRSHSREVVPQLVFACDEESLKWVAETLNRPLPDVLRESLPTSMVLILACYASQGEGEEEDPKARAKSSHDLLISYLTEEGIAQVVERTMDEFVVELLSRTFESPGSSTLLSKYFKSHDPEPCSPHYSTAAVRGTLSHLASCYGGSNSGSTFIRVLCRKKDKLQRVLLGMSLRIESTHRVFRKRQLLVAYSFFVSMLCEELTGAGLEGMDAFVVMDTIHTMLRVLRRPLTQKNEFFALACETLWTICKAALGSQSHVKELCRHVEGILATMIPFARLQTEEGAEALRLINLLVRDSGSELLNKQAAVMDPFPEAPPFLDLCKRQQEAVGHTSLKQEIQRFLLAGRDTSETFRTDGVRFLKTKVAVSRWELEELTREGQCNLVSQLIQELVGLCRHPGSKREGEGQDSQELVSEVARCLGEIGAVELGSIALVAVDDKSCGQSDVDLSLFGREWSAGEQVAAQVLQLLSRLLMDEEIEVVKASGECIRAVLLTKTGAGVLGKLEGLAPGDSWCAYLEPFKPGKKKKAVGSSAPAPSPTVASLDVENLWIPAASVAHGNWITTLVGALITSGAMDDEVLVQLKPVCETKGKLPSCAQPTSPRSSALRYGTNEVQRCIGQSENRGRPAIQSANVGRLDNTVVQDLLLEACRNIGEPDSLYGACSTLSLDARTLLTLYEHEGQWQAALGAYNLQMQLPGAAVESNLMKCLQNLGLNHVLLTYLRGASSLSPHTPQVAGYQYEAAWRCSIWDNSVTNFSPAASEQNNYHKHIYNALLAVKEGDNHLLLSSLVQARSTVINQLCSTGLESAYSIYPALSRLQAVQELEDAATSIPGERHFLDRWKHRELASVDVDFPFIELLLALRSSVLMNLMTHVACGARQEEGQAPSVDVRRELEGFFVAQVSMLVSEVHLARQTKNFHVAEHALFVLKHLSLQRDQLGIATGSLGCSVDWTREQEEAKLCWAKGEKTHAIHQMRSLLKKLEGLTASNSQATSVYPTALCLYGNWLAEMHLESPTVIMTKYLQEAVTLMETSASTQGEELIKAYLTLARYADSQYQRIERHMSSPAFEAKKQLLQQSKRDLEKLQTMSGDQRQIARHMQMLKSQSEEDAVSLDSLINDKQQFLGKAVQNYILCLRTGNEHDLRIFRLCALWFDNSDQREMNRTVENGFRQLQSYKFLPLMYQLAARMSAAVPTSPFQTILQELICRVTIDHPHHCLYVVLALANASKDDTFSSEHTSGSKASARTNAKLSKAKSTQHTTVDEDKVKAAKGVIAAVHSKKPSLVQSIQLLCDAYIDLAYHNVDAHKKSRDPIPLPKTCPLLKLTNMVGVAIPTVNLEVDPSCCYDKVVSLVAFDNHFELAGGINLPKVLSCTGSDGRRRKQLVKGKDDLRQDAVMQQVFILVNRLLVREPVTRKRKLSIRTYKVIPLSQRSGIVEWCEGTVPLGFYLIGTPQKPSDGAHSRYRPMDWPSSDCRKRLMDVAKKTKVSKLQVFQEICQHFRPVFHHFFMEHFANPSEWFEKRLAYTRSVAASSIVGYIVGLGDRHVQNILIDTKTAEFIHIDLGVAFEQGKTLPTPETVPFRLTQDLVDGMGIAGVEGVFRRCCEETLVVMRASHEELKTIVQVLIYDPLYLWNISPLKALSLQRQPEGEETATTHRGGGEMVDGDQTAATSANSCGSSNKMAERVLLRLQEKLEGIEDGVPLGISGQVNHLIQEATDIANLCQLFPGWQPWI